MFPLSLIFNLIVGYQIGRYLPYLNDKVVKFVESIAPQWYLQPSVPPPLTSGPSAIILASFYTLLLLTAWNEPVMTIATMTAVLYTFGSYWIDTLTSSKTLKDLIFGVYSNLLTMTPSS